MKILVIVDMQNDFVTGALGSKEAQEAVPNIVGLVETGEYDRIYATLDTHKRNYLETLEYFKKSAKGCVWVKGEDGMYTIEDGLTLDEMQMAMLHDKGGDGMYLVFNDGRLVNEAVADTLPMIRERLDTYRRKQYGV